LDLIVPVSPFSAALEVATAHGLPTRDAQVIRDATNVLVHLKPAPVIARVPLTLARLRDRAWFTEEVELASFLAQAGAPVVPPTENVDPGPHEHGLFLVSFWTHVGHDPERFDAPAAGRSLRELHQALQAFHRPLPAWERLDEVGRVLDLIQPSELVSPSELGALHAVRERLLPPPELPQRPLHGDSHFRNLLWTSAGPLWTDLENACAGPVEYDLACLHWRDDPGTADALASYGAYDEVVVEQVTPYLVLFLAAWMILVVERAPSEGGRAEARRRIERALAHAGSAK
jgi:hypothetical protein